VQLQLGGVLLAGARDDAQGLFIDSSSAIDQLPHVLAAAESAAVESGDDDLAADVASYGMAPLFDGADLERI
jgi:hypothetical protein